MATILLIEPFYVGSHKQLMDVLKKEIPDVHLLTLPGKKWQWKARTAALYLSQVIPRDHCYRTIFASSVLNLAEMVALRPDLMSLKKVLYFHENQLVYPVRQQKDRDFQYGYNQILSSLVADVVLFNSQYNMDSFLNNIPTFLKVIPDHRPKGIPEQICNKCHVLNFPIVFPQTYKHTTVDVAGECKSKIDRQKDDSECKGETDSQSADSDKSFPINFVALDKDLTDIKVVREQKCLQDMTQLGFTNPHVKLSSSYVVEHLQMEGSNLQSNFHDSKSLTQVQHKDIEGVKALDLLRKDCEELVPKKMRMSSDENFPLHIVWPHRWEHDKGPETFFQIIIQLNAAGCDFRLSVLGETFQDIPDIFEESKKVLEDKIHHWGYQESKQDYYNILSSADCVVSTAIHEFFGVAMLEAVHLGCYPLCPNRLVYPEIFPKQCLYNTDQQLFKRLREMCRKPHLVRSNKVHIDTAQYAWEALKDDFCNYLGGAKP